MIEFNEETHEYFNDGKKLISTTQMLKKYGFAPDYSGVADEVLKAKAERGSLVHEEIENYIKNGDIGFTEEFTEFVDYIDKNGINPLNSEFIVYNDCVAGTVDFIYEQDGKTILADFKTTSTLHKDTVAWQLSIYKALYGGTVDGIKAFHFTKDGLKVVDLLAKPTEQVEALFEAERNNTEYAVTPVNADKLQALEEIEEYIKNIEETKKEYEKQAEEMRSAILEEMKKTGTQSLETDKIKLTYVAPFTRSSIDSKKLKEEMPEVYEKYQKETTVKESLKITVKKNEN